MKEVFFLSSPPLPRSFTCAIFCAFLVPRSLLLNRTEKLATSGRKNVLRKLLRIPYRRLKAGFSLC